ncbi:MAG TPA: cupin domain-containing protein [Phycisphaerae bacterium]|nr:cupin domain-containing protein [Phycisphaerae bacterium]
MAHLHVPAENLHLSDPDQIAAYLAPSGIFYERWDSAADLPDSPTNEQILQGYDTQIRALMQKGGYATADVINVTPDLPNLQSMLDRFNKEHTHTDDEVRFIVKGRGIFHIHPAAGPVFAIEMHPGDLINVPAGTQHWFDLCADRTIRAIRLFKDNSGWTPYYVETGVHGNFQPLCWGPSYLPPGLPKISNPVLA